MTLNPQDTFVLLGLDGTATELPGGEAFWSLPGPELERHGRGWLVSEIAFAADWPNWERHPAADEFAYLLAGSIELVLELPEGPRTVAIQGRGAAVIPRGVWHTAKVHTPSRLLFITLGAGTDTRPV